MKKKIFCCLLAAAVLTGSTGSLSLIVAAENDIPATVTEQETLTEDNAVFDWDKNSDSEIIIDIDLNPDDIFAFKKNGILLASRLIKPFLSFMDGQLQIQKEFLKNLDVGKNVLTFVLKDTEISITIDVTDSQEPQESSSPYEEESSDTQREITADCTSFEWDRSSLLGITVKTNSRSKTVSLMKDGETFADNRELGLYTILGKIGISSSLLRKLDDGENKLSLVMDDGTIDITVNVTDNNQQEISAEQTVFDWDKNDLLGIIINTNSKSKTVSLYKDGELFADNEIRKLFILAGKINISSKILQNLDVGENHLTVILDDAEIQITVNVTDDNQKELSAEQTVFDWDKSSLTGIIVHTNSDSKTVSLYKDGELFAQNEILKLFMLGGKINISSKILKNLEVGENHLTLALEDGNIDITVNVTDRNKKEITADNTVFNWDKSDLKGIFVKTNSQSKTVSLYKDEELFAENEKLNLFILLGNVGISPKILKNLEVGENHLTLALEDGNIDITVNVTDRNKKEITADNTVFNWDKSDFLGIIVKTDSQSKTVSLYKDEELFAENEKLKLFVLLGRVCVSPKILKNLDVGTNKLTVMLDDGTVDITVNVTDTKNTSADLKADQTSFTWNRNSLSGITVRTNSASDTVMIRKDGKLFAGSDGKNVIMQNGNVTISPDVLGRLDNGTNNLTMSFSDGTIDIAVTVTDGNASYPTISGNSSYSYNNNNGNNFLSPYTGDILSLLLPCAAAVSAISAGIFLFLRRKKSVK